MSVKQPELPNLDVNPERVKLIQRTLILARTKCWHASTDSIGETVYQYESGGRIYYAHLMSRDFRPNCETVPRDAVLTVWRADPVKPTRRWSCYVRFDDDGKFISGPAVFRDANAEALSRFEKERKQEAERRRIAEATQSRMGRKNKTFTDYSTPHKQMIVRMFRSLEADSVRAGRDLNGAKVIVLTKQDMKLLRSAIGIYVTMLLTAKTDFHNEVWEEAFWFSRAFHQATETWLLDDDVQDAVTTRVKKAGGLDSRKAS